MREKQLRLIITFNSATDAIKFEKYCQKEGIEGRLIPVPRTISASCGLCWRTSPEKQSQIEKDIKDANLSISGIYQWVL